MRPNDAPLLTPSTDGSARGFREMAWKPRPARDRQAPTIPANSVRGRRIFRTIVAAVSWDPPSTRPRSTSHGDSETLPTITEATTLATRIAESHAKTAA